jgi:hypothetical protein
VSNDWWAVSLGIVGGLVLIWAVLVAVLWLTKPGEYDVKETLRLLPDLIRLVKRLATDPDTRAACGFCWWCCSCTSRCPSI